MLKNKTIINLNLMKKLFFKWRGAMVEMLSDCILLESHIFPSQPYLILKDSII